MKISVIICTKDRRDDLKQTLESIGRQTYMPDEIVVVDASCNDEVLELVHSLPLNIRYVRTEPGLTKQRNIGIESSAGDIIIFFDDDVDLTPRCIERFVCAFEQTSDDVVAVCGRILNSLPDLRSFKKRVFYIFDRCLQKIFMLPEEDKRGYFKYSTACIRPYLSNEPDFTEVLSGGCSGYRREIFQTIRFDENLKKYAYAEDLDISRQIFNAGYRIYYEPEASLYHYPSPASRLSRREGSKMFIENMFYIYRKNYRLSFPKTLAVYWFFLGVCVQAFLHRDFDSLHGTIAGIKEIFKNQSRWTTNIPRDWGGITAL